MSRPFSIRCSHLIPVALFVLGTIHGLMEQRPTQSISHLCFFPTYSPLHTNNDRLQCSARMGNIKRRKNNIVKSSTWECKAFLCIAT